MKIKNCTLYSTDGDGFSMCGDGPMTIKNCIIIYQQKWWQKIIYGASERLLPWSWHRALTARFPETFFQKPPF